MCGYRPLSKGRLLNKLVYIYIYKREGMMCRIFLTILHRTPQINGIWTFFHFPLSIFRIISACFRTFRTKRCLCGRQVSRGQHTGAPVAGAVSEPLSLSLPPCSSEKLVIYTNGTSPLYSVVTSLLFEKLCSNGWKVSVLLLVTNTYGKLWETSSECCNHSIRIQLQFCILVFCQHLRS